MRRNLLLLAVLSAVLAAAACVPLSTLLAPLHKLIALTATHPVAAAGLFVLLYVTSVAFSLPIASLLTLCAGALFGPLAGTLLVLLSATTGATMLFWLVKKGFGQSLANQAKTSPRLTSILTYLQNNAFMGLFTIRLIPLFPFFLVNLAPAFINMPTRSYIAATALGIAPGTAIYVYTGHTLGQSLLQNPQGLSLTSLLTPNLILALILLSTFSLATAILARRLLTPPPHQG